ncbi:dihydrolipoyl dehydrogenase [Methanobrevibacter woesei]|uniref:Dihydrolipoyl dehydrogenase n=1 Tax=Methanobrevibacter woesei TaxID=190976 RepID=A0A2U1S662_9EURY|nr:NAD(P)/FAD-dependent oxidoreductase [Methanobrevibacter woesei]PWB85024.1 dihydrolipoyl dehydrogenase [Methanobrevibacter woesei]
MDNIIIGSGPSGRLAALQLGKLGQKVKLIEKKHIAGTCLNEGCMVICALTDVTKFIETNNRFNKRGFIKSQLDVSYDKIVEKIKETQTMLRSINQEECEAAGNELIYGEAKIENEEVIVNNESFTYDNLLIATGARPFIPDIEGNEYGLTSSDILNLDDIPKQLNIIGGGVIAIEVANIFSKLGSEVNLFARSTVLKDIKDEDATSYILKHLIPEINIHEHVNVDKLTKNKLVLESGEEFEGKSLFATGRIPNSEIAEGIVELNPNKTIKVNERMQTNVDNIYAAGDVTGGIQLTPIARMEGICAARNMANYPNKISYNSVPQTLNLNTEVSFVENEKIDENHEIVDIGFPGIAGPGNFWTIMDGETGFTKVSFDADDNKIKRITSISPSSVSDVAYLSYIMREDYDLNDYDDFIEIHPSTDTNYKIIKNMWL